MHAASIPGFEILEQLQESSKSLIWRARQHSLDRIVMLKLLRPEAAAQPAELARFLLVARTLARLKADGLSQIYDVVSEGERHYIVMEAVDGPTLTDLVGQKGCLPVTQAARIAFTVSEALGQAWDAGRLVHRNLKPTGIRLDSRGVAKIVDFGQAVVAVADHVADPDEGHIIGTPNFLSPEQCAGEKQLDCRADMYALGAVLYYILTGHMPFSELPVEAVIQMQIYGQLPHPHKFRAELPAPACGLIERLTMKHPDDRYATWTEAMGDIQHILKNMPLRRRETQPKGTATLAPDAPSATAAATPGPRRAAPPPPAAAAAAAPAAARPAAAPAAAVGRRPKPAAPVTARPRADSSFSRVILWLLLGCWLAVLANDRLGDPLRLGVELRSVPGAIRSWVSPSPAATVGRPRTETAPQPAYRPAPPAPAPAPTTLPAPLPDPVVIPSVSPPPTPRSSQPDGTALSPELTGRLSVAFSRGDLEAARTMLRNAPETAAVLAARDLLNEVPDINRLTEDGIMRMRGQEIAIEFNNTSRLVIPQRVVNGRIFVTVAADKRMVDFETDRLAPKERLRWAGTLDTPARQIAACAMMLKANDTVYVAAHAGACGILAPAFEMAANR